jgi:hypothetical protein
MAGITGLYSGIRHVIRTNKEMSIVFALGMSANLPLGIPLAIDNMLLSEPKVNSYEKLATAAEYLGTYEGAEPAKAIDYAYEIVDLVKQANPGEEHIIALESELKSLEESIVGIDNPLIYKPMISEAVSAIWKYSSSHDQTFGSLLLSGLILSAIPIDALVFSAFLPTAEERAERNNNANTARRRQRYDNDLHNNQNDIFRNHDN